MVGVGILRVENATLSWDASLNGTVSVWMLAPTSHQLSGKIHPAVAYEHVAVEAVEGSITLDEEGYGRTRPSWCSWNNPVVER